jgi:hypothetical protein
MRIFSSKNRTLEKEPEKRKGFFNNLFDAGIGAGKHAKSEEQKQEEQKKQEEKNEKKKMKVKFMNSNSIGSDFTVVYNSDRRRKRIEVRLSEKCDKKRMASDNFRREVSNKIADVVRANSLGSGIFKKQQGISQMSHSSSNVLADNIYKNREIKKVLQLAASGRLGNRKSSRRKVMIEI